MPQLACTALLGALLAGCAGPAAAVGGLTDLSVYDRNEGRTLPVHWHEGRAYVIGRPGNEYQLNVRNRQGEDVLAVLSVDGINVITGQTASVQQSGYVLAPGGALEVKGWRKDLTRTAAFYFTSLSDSYAARTGRPDNVGAIGVALFRRKPPEPAPFSQIAPARPQAGLSRKDASGAGAAADQAAPRAEGAARSAAEAPLGTGHGRNETSYARTVGFERASAEPAETVVIYYDSCSNLIARGIIPRGAAPCAGRHVPQPAPNPFPGFVADPPA
jgi:hypothetical protein